ncbi:MAG: primosomal protein [Chlamydiota bacterium]|jgi:primosomal protein N' (replication factor Y)
MTIASVLLDDALDRPLDYKIPESWTLLPGMRVKVPVRNSVREGTVIALKDSSAFDKLSFLQEVLLEHQSIPQDLMALGKWVSHYYCTPLQKALSTLLPPSVKGENQAKLQKFITLLKSANQTAQECAILRKRSPKQAAILDALLASPSGLFLSALKEIPSFSKSALDTLAKQGLIEIKEQPFALLQDVEYIPTFPKQLNIEQSAALDAIKQDLASLEFHVRLIHGITGSGKTEVYLQAIDAVTRQGGGVIFLVPEIALTSQMIEKLKGRFCLPIAILHSQLSDKERFSAWHGMREGKIKIAIGARSAIFSPIQNLKLIIVDEEHEGSYKSDQTPHYHARDVAIMRGKITKSTVLLGSATPSIETYYNATTGKYKLSTLSSRADQASLPSVKIIDMKEEMAKQKRFTLFSDALIAAIKEKVSLGEQVILFLNRRGYHTAQLCKNCGETSECPHCDVNLTFHHHDNRLTCHLCGYCLSPPPKTCPKCHKEDTFQFKGAGTELVERSLHALLPHVKTLRLDADTTKHKGSHEQLFRKFRSGKADVLIGTQMIAKGLHFPQVTLVAVLNADSGLQIPDFRGSETTFQLLTQVAGRAGRGMLKGEVILQTHLPDHPLIQLTPSQNYQDFFTQEIASRELFHYPPFTHLIKISFRGKDASATEARAEAIRQHLLKQLPPSVELLAVVASGHAKVKDLFRFQFLIKTPKISPLLPLLHELKKEKHPIQMIIDVDPLSTFL